MRQSTWCASGQLDPAEARVPPATIANSRAAPRSPLDDAYDSSLCRHNNGGRPVMDVELVPYVLDVNLYSLFADVKGGRDFLVAHAPGNQLQYFQLAMRQFRLRGASSQQCSPCLSNVRTCDWQRQDKRNTLVLRSVSRRPLFSWQLLWRAGLLAARGGAFRRQLSPAVVSAVAWCTIRSIVDRKTLRTSARTPDSSSPPGCGAAWR